MPLRDQLVTSLPLARICWAALVALAAPTASSSAAETTATYDLLILAGQSNAVGYDAKPSELPADAIDKTILFWWKTGDPPPDEHDSTSGGWTHLQPQPLGKPKTPRAGRQYGNFAQPDGGFGPEISLARRIASQPNGPKVAVVKAAFSGTSMAQDWNPDDPGDGGSCYRALVTQTRAAIAAAQTEGKMLRLRGFFWVQGESDANATAAPMYQQALARMLAALRRDLDAPQLPAFLSVNTQFGGGKNPFLPQVIAAQRALDAVEPSTVYVDTETAAIANAVHWNATGTLDVGERFARALLAWEAEHRANP